MKEDTTRKIEQTEEQESTITTQESEQPEEQLKSKSSNGKRIAYNIMFPFVYLVIAPLVFIAFASGIVLMGYGETSLLSTFMGIVALLSSIITYIGAIYGTIVVGKRLEGTYILVSIASVLISIAMWVVIGAFCFIF